MKNLAKKGLVFLSALILISCQNDFDDNLDKDLSNALQTKSSVSTPSVLSQLSGIPVNIKMKGGNWKNPYLSARPKDNNVVLYDKDDGSLRQRWLITFYGSSLTGEASIQVEGGTNTNGYLVPIGEPGSYVPKLWNAPLSNVHMEEGTIESTFYIYTNGKSSGFIPVKEYLYSKDAVNQDLAFAEENKTGGRYVWEISPVEPFTLQDVSYFKDSGDRIDSSLVFIRDYDIDNRENPSPTTHTIHINENYSVSSSFSETTGLNMSDKISNATSFKVGLPTIDLSGNVSFEHLTEHIWSFSSTDTETRTFSWIDDFTTVVPANTLMKLRVYEMVYTFDITYVGTLVGIRDKTIRLKGRWKGSMGSKFRYKPLVNNELMLGVDRVIENGNKEK